MDPRIKHILDKIQAGKDLSSHENRELSSWLRDENNTGMLKRDTQLHLLINKALLEFDAAQAFERAEKRIRKKGVVRNLNTFYRYAAAVAVIVLSAGYLFLETSTETGAAIQLPENQISIILESGEVKEIHSEEAFHLTDDKGLEMATVKGDTLNYTQAEATASLVYNTIHIPYGKTFKLKLNDGTYVYLNSGSELRYPVHFKEGERRVFLKGQGYFDVTKNKKSPFVVTTDNKEILVYGTKFDVSEYPNEPISRTVLLEGSVGIREKGTDQEVTQLKPNEAGSWMNTENQTVSVTEVDAEEYTSWIYGLTSIDNKDFAEVLRIIERKYNVTITNEYPEINTFKFHGTFLNESLTDILDVFKGSLNFEYTISGNNIIITKNQ